MDVLVSPDDQKDGMVNWNGFLNKVDAVQYKLSGIFPLLPMVLLCRTALTSRRASLTTPTTALDFFKTSRANMPTSCQYR